MKKTIIILILISIFCSCNSKKKSSSTFTYETVNIEINNETFNFSNIFDEVEIIQLKDELFGRIKKLYEADDKIIFQTSSGDKRVHIYDLKQNSLKSIVKIGDAPNEFRSIGDLSFFSNKLYVLDYIKKELHEFSLTGELKQIIKLPDYCDITQQIDSLTFILCKKVPYSSNSEFKINVYTLQNEESKLIQQAIPVKEFEVERDFNQLTTLYSVNDTVRFTQAFSDTIYNVFRDRIVAQYVLDFGNKDLPHEMYNNPNANLMEFAAYCKTSNNIWNINGVLENSNFLFFVFRYKGKTYSSLYNKSTKKCTTFNKFSDDVFTYLEDSEISVEFMPVFISQKALYYVIEPYVLINAIELLKKHDYKKWNHMKEIQHKLFELATNLKEEDNSIIIKYLFKDK